jgi:hypothetical protein
LAVCTVSVRLPLPPSGRQLCRWGSLIERLSVDTYVGVRHGRTGATPGSAAMPADARQTEFCTYLSAILPGGGLLNPVWGLRWLIPSPL